MTKRIYTNDEIEKFLGTSNPEEEAIEIITEIANGTYKPKQLREDIKETLDVLQEEDE
jgi:hypothetical protein